jgi:hypothetical protein
LFVNVFFFNCRFTTETSKLLHDPSLTTRRIMLAAVDSLFTTTDLAFAIGNFEFAVEDILKPHVAVLPPPRWSEIFFLDHLLDNSLNGRMLERRLRYTRRTGRGNRSEGSRSNHATGGTGQNFCFTSSDLGFAHCDIALTSYESLGPLGREHTPDSLGSGISRSGTTGRALAGEGKHDGEDREDEG